MKKMYKTPIVEEVRIAAEHPMATAGVSSGGTGTNAPVGGIGGAADPSDAPAPVRNTLIIR